MQQPHANEVAMTEQRPNVLEGGNPVSAHPTYEAEIDMDRNCDQVLRTAIVGILMIWVFIAFIAGFIDPESRPIFPKWGKNKRTGEVLADMFGISSRPIYSP